MANWKSHKTMAEAQTFIEQYDEKSTQTVIVCPPFPYLLPLKEAVAQKQIKLGAQDISNYPFGAYTGAVSADMLKGVAEYVIVGHSERRRYFQETNEVVANKARLALEAGMTPIVCLDKPYMNAQLAFFGVDECLRMIIAYEPVEAIGSGQPDTPEAADAVAAIIQQLTQSTIPVIYGGSVDEKNVASFVAQPHISGVLVGGASLEVNQWQALVQAAN